MGYKQAKLCGFFVDRSTNLFGKLCRNFSHAMRLAGMFGTLLQNLLLGLAFCYEIAVYSNFSAANDLGHMSSLIRQYSSSRAILTPASENNSCQFYPENSGQAICGLQRQNID
jgi:hypothetical protein